MAEALRHSANILLLAAPDFHSFPAVCKRLSFHIDTKRTQMPSLRAVAFSSPLRYQSVASRVFDSLRTLWRGQGFQLVVPKASALFAKSTWCRLPLALLRRNQYLASAYFICGE